jgi:parvulin-like peptidyl-prolyl isomerase
MSGEPKKISDKLRISLLINRLLYFLCLISAIAACGPLDQTEDNIGLVVGSSHITTDKLKTDMEFISAGMEVQAKQRDLVRNQLMEQCINHYLIMEYGKEQGIAISENELQNTVNDIRKGYSDTAFDEALIRGYVDFEKWKNRLKELLLIRKIIEKVTQDIPQPGYQDIKQYFEANQDEFKSPSMIEFRQIVTNTKEEAESLRHRLYKGESMTELAKKHSVAPEAQNGGKVGWVAEGQLNESMENVLFAMAEGEISPVVETPYGYHIFEVLSVRAAGLKELSDVIDEIQSKLVLQKREAMLKKWLKDLRNHFEVKINESLLNKLEFS